MDWSHIDLWLLKIYKQTILIPKFERSNKNYQILTKLENSNFNSIELIDYILRNKNDFELSDESIQHVESLATIANALGMENTELSNYITSISKLTIDKMEASHELTALIDVEHKIDSLQYEATLELDKMKKLLDKIRKEHNVNEQNRKDNRIIQSVQEKSNELANLQKTYDELGIEEQDLRLTDIHELESKRNSLVKAIKEKDEKLLSFQGLPLVNNYTHVV
ncbi:uncharacterized protein BX663DRAFT_492006 [Cokeromyces recurvatus]|uniref:uncharacterized protein n=1 Tax=Cokeromyces recurvatus TaxID=90255 RepID=UPI0022209584|nr:uncharacterized protein BX663DRAFT_492006 [Cokeromyces recurvatus]KAI7907791.1 hypothetical protein BX663DRAFT_492006 [Cokeromyces recurvatus]